MRIQKTIASFQIQSSYFKFRIQDTTKLGEFLFWICPLVNKWKNQSGTEILLWCKPSLSEAIITWSSCL